MVQLNEHVAAIREAIAQALQRLLAPDGLPLYEMVRYHLGFIDVEGRPAGGAGKTLRPVLCCLACEAVSGAWRPALGAAVALELTHNFSLVHDDIEDGDRERRHRPTVWSRWGIAQGINTGDAIWALAWEAMAGAIGDRIPAQTIVESTRRLAVRCREMIEGQYLDLALEGRTDADLDQYLRIVHGKTGGLLACSLELGALFGGAEPAVADAFSETGRLLGVAFQMQDDILGVWGDPAITGKAADSDIRRRKMALPAICALQTQDPESRAILEEIYFSQHELSHADVAEVLRLFEQAQVRKTAERLAQNYTARARRALAELPVLPGGGAFLNELVSSLVGRQS